MSSKYKGLSTVHTALGLLDAFSLERPEWGVRELARSSSLPQATTSRLVSTLCNEGFLVKTTAHRYRLGTLLQDISLSAVRGQDLYLAGLTELVRLRTLSGFASTLSVLEDGSVVVIERLGTFEGETLRSPRRCWPAHATAAGKAILAFSAPEIVEDALGKSMEKCTPYTVTRRSLTAAELEAVRTNGFAVEVEESQVGWRSLAAPIFDAAGVNLGAVAVETSRPTWNPRTASNALHLVRLAVHSIGQALS